MDAGVITIVAVISILLGWRAYRLVRSRADVRDARASLSDKRKTAWQALKAFLLVAAVTAVLLLALSR